MLPRSGLSQPARPALGHAGDACQGHDQVDHHAHLKRGPLYDSSRYVGAVSGLPPACVAVKASLAAKPT